MSAEPEEQVDLKGPRGPHGWHNWRAERSGAERRTTKHPDNVVVRPIWQEFALYTDSELTGPWLMLGPYEFIEIDHPRAMVGVAHKLVILRVWDHLEDQLLEGVPEPETDVEDFTGGDIGDELTALLGLALGRRFRSGGMVRQGLPGGDPLGIPGEETHRAPDLEPPRHRPMIATLADPTSMGAAKDLLNSYPDLDGSDAVALVRAARQYVDGLWLADRDPRLAWIKLVGALEAAANRYDVTQTESPVAQLKRHKPDLYRILEPTPELLEAVADETSRLFRSEVKMQAFVKAFDPGPPAIRPEGSAWEFDWAEVGDALRIIYDHRSADLHGGVAFPPPLCEPPIFADKKIPAERFPALAVSTLGAEWTAEQLPMYMHVFAHLVGGAICSWWRSL